MLPTLIFWFSELWLFCSFKVDFEKLHRATYQSKCTMWKLQNFAVIHILREINFGESKIVKLPFFVISRALKFDTLTNFWLKKVHKFTKIKIQSLQMSWNGKCYRSRTPQIDFLCKLSDRRIMKFPHYQLATLISFYNFSNYSQVFKTLLENGYLMFWKKK